MYEAGPRSRMRRLGACVFSLTIALIATEVPTRVMCAENQLQQAHAAAGRVWYEKYCTSCHGQGGGPGSAVYRGSDRPVDLRTYVKRNNGIFPAVEWIAVVEHVDLSSPHADDGDPFHCWEDPVVAFHVGPEIDGPVAATGSS